MDPLDQRLKKLQSKITLNYEDIKNEYEFTQNPHVTNIIILLLFLPLTLMIIFFPLDSFLSAIFFFIWVWDCIFLFYSMFYLRLKIIIDKSGPYFFPVNVWVSRPGDIGENSIVEGSLFILIAGSVGMATWALPITMIPIIITFIFLTFLYEKLFPVKDDNENVVVFPNRKTKLFFIVSFICLPMLIAFPYVAVDYFSMWIFMGLWCLVNITYFRLIRKGKIPIKPKLNSPHKQKIYPL